MRQLPVTSMRAYLHNIGDWATHTHHLSWTQLAAYHLLIEAYYTKEQPLPGDIAQVCRIVGAATHNEREAVKAVLHEFFVHDTTTNVWHHARCDSEISNHAEFMDKQRTNGAKRWGNTVTAQQTEKAIKKSESILSSMLHRFQDRPNTGTPETNGDTMGLQVPSQTSARPHDMGMPIYKVNNNTLKHTHSLVTETAREAAFVCVKNGLKVEETNSLLCTLIAAGAGIADFAEAATLAVARGKDFNFAAGIVRNRLSDSTMGLKGPQTGQGSTIDADPMSAYLRRSKVAQKPV